jgi:hypothetical protein
VGVSGPRTSEVVEVDAGMSGRGREIGWGSLPSREEDLPVLVGSRGCRDCRSCCCCGCECECECEEDEGPVTIASSGRVRRWVGVVVVGAGELAEIRRSGEDMDPLRSVGDTKGAQPIPASLFIVEEGG